MASTRELQDHRPAQRVDGPWADDKRWSSGRVADGSTAHLVFLWVFAALWNAVSMPAVIVGFHRVRRDHPETFLLLLFPLIGVGFLGGAIRLTLRRLKHGRSHFEMETLPGCVGGWLAGTVRTSAPLREADVIHLALRCVRRVTRRTRGKSETSERTVWEDEHILAGPLPIDRGGGGHSIPIAFRIPPGGSPTSDHSGDQVIWRLRVRAAVPGVDYAAEFAVPVFDAAQPDGFVPRAEHEAAPRRAPREAVAALEDPRIHVSANAAGRRHFVFPAIRNRAPAAALTCLSAIFSGGAYAALPMGAPRLFPLLFGLIALALAYAAALYWFRHVELFVDRHGIERQWRMLGMSGSRRVPAADVVEVRRKVTAEANETPYHTVVVVRRGGPEVSLVSNLRTRDAAYVVEQITRSLGAAE